MRDFLGYGSDGIGYAAYLRDTGEALRVIELSCLEDGFILEQLPSKLGKPYQTVATHACGWCTRRSAERQIATDYVGG